MDYLPFPFLLAADFFDGGCEGEVLVAAGVATAGCGDATGAAGGFDATAGGAAAAGVTIGAAAAVAAGAASGVDDAAAADTGAAATPRTNSLRICEIMSSMLRMTS